MTIRSRDVRHVAALLLCGQCLSLLVGCDDSPLPASRTVDGPEVEVSSGQESTIRWTVCTEKYSTIQLSMRAHVEQLDADEAVERVAIGVERESSAHWDYYAWAERGGEFVVTHQLTSLDGCDEETWIVRVIDERTPTTVRMTTQFSAVTANGEIASLEAGS